MPREFVILSPEPITAVEVVAAAAALDPSLGLGRLWGGGGLQVAGDALVLAVLRSTTLGSGADTAYLLGQPVPADAAWATEAYGPFDEPLTPALVHLLARDTGGTVVPAGD